MTWPNIGWVIGWVDSAEGYEAARKYYGCPPAIDIRTGTRELLRTAVMDASWQCLCSAQEFLERSRGTVGISPAHFFAYWRMQLEAAFFGGDDWVFMVRKPDQPQQEVVGA